MAIGCLHLQFRPPFRPDVYLEPFPGPVRESISSNGGAQGTWSRDGKQIFLSHRQKNDGCDLRRSHHSVNAPRVLFQTRIVAPNFVTRQYDVGPTAASSSTPCFPVPRPSPLLTNWTEQNNR
jgi:hypothetical protein